MALNPPKVLARSSVVPPTDVVLRKPLALMMPVWVIAPPALMVMLPRAAELVTVPRESAPKVVRLMSPYELLVAVKPPTELLASSLVP